MENSGSLIIGAASRYVKEQAMTKSLGRPGTGTRMLIGICAAVLLTAASQGHAQPTSNTATWLEEEAKTTSSGIAADAAKDIDKHIVPSSSGDSSILDTILDLLGLGGYFGSPTQDSIKSSGTALEHLERVDDRRAASATLETVGSGVSKGNPLPRSELIGEQPQLGPLVARRQQAQDEKLAALSQAPKSWVPEFWRDFWQAEVPPEDSSDDLSDLDMYVTIALGLAVLGVIGFLMARRKAA
jgi:hypothetical protein